MQPNASLSVNCLETELVTGLFNGRTIQLRSSQVLWQFQGSVSFKETARLLGACLQHQTLSGLSYFEPTDSRPSELEPLPLWRKLSRIRQSCNLASRVPGAVQGSQSTSHPLVQPATLNGSQMLYLPGWTGWAVQGADANTPALASDALLSTALSRPRRKS